MMTGRMAKLDRVLALVHALSESNDGLTLDEMAERVGVNRRTAERMRDIIALHFNVDEVLDDRRKRFVIRDSLRRIYTRPVPAEIAALQVEVETRQKAGQHERGAPLSSLLAKIRSAFDDRERRRIEPDLDALSRVQRTMVGPGPLVIVQPETLAIVQTAILAGCCLEFDYATEEHPEPKWRRAVPYGLVHGPVTYMVGKMPSSDRDPILYRLDRMSQPRLSDKLGVAPDDWDIDAWLAKSFGVWRDPPQCISLRVNAAAAVRARQWRFHPEQQMLDTENGGLRVTFTSGGLRELAEHLFHWAGDIVIEGPEELKQVMRERLLLAQNMIEV